MTALWIVLAVVVLLVFVYIGIHNNLIRLRNDCQEGFATMDVYLKKRFDLIPNLVETVKAYAKHEADTLQAVIAARNAAGTTQTTAERAKDENMISGALKNIFALSESYPDLKANASFLDLQQKLTGLEDEISQSRKYYNAVVKNYNNACMIFPSSLIANAGHFEPAVMFAVDDAAERENVSVKF
ncbi:MAG: LemA family protein [Ruthenibacterium sp.]